jgi:type IV pilus assembly protein PilM
VTYNIMSSVFGLDIGSSTIKAVWLQRNGDDVVFKSAIAAQTPEKGMLSDSSLDQEEMAQTLRKLILDAKFSPRDANLALPDNNVYAKVIEMPVLSDKELSSAIYWEAEQHIPVPLNTINLDWKVLRKDTTSAKSPKMQVLLVGAPTIMLKKYQEVFSLAGINIASMETEILSVIRATAISDDFPTSLIVNIGSLGTSIAIVQQGTLVFLYSIPLGGIAMNRAIATEFAFTAIQAEEYKKVYGIDESMFGGKIREAVEPVLASLITEIKKALSYYSDKYRDEHPISQIVLTGGSAKLPGIIPMFVEQLGIETLVSNPWKTANIQHVPQSLVDRGSEYTIAVGLALKDI